MGVSPYNNMQNLLDDCQSGTIDVFLHVSHFRSCEVFAICLASILDVA